MSKDIVSYLSESPEQKQHLCRGRVDVQVQLLRRQLWAQLGGMKCLVL